MAWTFRPANRSEAKPLIGIYALSGNGKTLSALLLARGYVGPSGKVGMIETESGRGEAFADDPRVAPYIVCPIRGDFSPTNYGEAISAAEEAKLDALIIDSASHEWEGAGGVLSMAAMNQAPVNDGGKGYKGPLVWQKPKLDHQRQFMLRLLGTPIPLVIICMRAKYPMKEIVEKGEKKWVRQDDLEPIQSDGILYEMFVHGWIDAEHKFRGTKYTTDALRKVLVDGEPISIATGQRLAAWSREATVPVVATSGASALPDGQVSGDKQAGNGRPVVSEDDPAERAKLIGDARRLAGSLSLPRPEQADLARKHCGGTDLNSATVAMLTALVNELRVRAGEEPWNGGTK